MAIEIERKFLVKGDSWRALGQGTAYRQGYLTSGQASTVRVRIAGDQAYLTIKGTSIDLARAEFEYPIPLADAAEMLETLCTTALIEKTRYKIESGGLLWEVDEFAGENQGLIIAEVELKAADQAIALPDWIGEEVSQDPRYFNSSLARYPFTHWGAGTAMEDLRDEGIGG